MCINEYASHNDQHKADIRRIAAAHNADRARMLATETERDMGCITLYMSKHELQRRLREALPPIKASVSPFREAFKNGAVFVWDEV
jgi:hypothetical protein